MKSVYFKSAITLAVTAAFLVACGGDPAPAPTPAATANTTANISATTAAAITGKTFAFPGGVAALGTTGATTLTITDAAVDTFAVTAPSGNYAGTVSYGSCIFTITSVGTPAPAAPYVVGYSFTVAACSATAATNGVAANGQSSSLPVTFNLGGTTSAAQSFPVTIAADGSVSIGGAPTGIKVPVATPTGS
jgi:hypothetical protein